MNALTRSLHTFLSQDVARQNAAAAARRVGRERQQRADVEAYLAQLDGRPQSPATRRTDSRATADLRGSASRV